MLYRLAADTVLLLHLGFIVFVVLGAALVARWPRLVALHLPAATWGFFVELTGRGCPLTAVENFLRVKAGSSGYAGSFVEHYLLAVLYPDGLTREGQFTLAAMVVIINAALYGWLLHRRHSRRTDLRARRTSGGRTA
jgi:hypothetical protein